jgi:transcription initiation factor TFIIIB Brf1 subunit/transcription initiation factor TFIIB
MRVTIGDRYRNLYVLPDYEEDVQKQIAMIRKAILTVLRSRLFLSARGIMNELTKSYPDINFSLVRVILKHLAGDGAIKILPLVTKKGTMAYLYLHPSKYGDFESAIESILEYYKKNKWGYVSRVSKEVGISPKFTGLLLRHLVYLGLINQTIGGYDTQTRKYYWLYYLPGFENETRRRRTEERRRRLINELKQRYKLILERLEIKNINEVSTKACRIFKEMIGKGLSKGLAGEIVAVASLIVALKLTKIAIPTEEVLEHSPLEMSSKRLVHTTIRRIVRGLKIRPYELRLDPEDFLDRIIGRLESLDEKEKNLLKKRSREVLEAVPKSFKYGKKPETLAAASIYVASNSVGGSLKFLTTQDNLAAAAKVTEVSIRNWYRKIAEFYEAA